MNTRGQLRVFVINKQYRSTTKKRPTPLISETTGILVSNIRFEFADLPEDGCGLCL